MSGLEHAIYEAAVIPSRWPLVLGELAERAGAAGGVLFSVTDHGAEWTASASLEEAMTAFVDEGWAADNSRVSRGMRQGLHLQPRFVVEQDYGAGDAIYADPVYQGFFLPRGLGQSAGTIAPLPHGDMLCFSFERAIELGPFDAASRAALDGYRPHLMRAAMLTARLGMERLRSSVETLAQLGFPAAALATSGRVTVANELFEAVEGLWTTTSGDRLALLDPAAAGLFRSALEHVGEGWPVRSIPLRQDNQPARHVIHLLPIRREVQDIFTRAAAILVLTSVRSLAGDPAILQVMFDLTLAEALLARRIAAGDSLGSISRNTGRSLSTVRNQLAAVLAKTGCTRQAELVAVLNGVTLPAG